MPKTMSHKIFAISIIQNSTAKFFCRKTQPRRQQRLNAVVNSEGWSYICIYLFIYQCYTGYVTVVCLRDAGVYVSFSVVTRCCNSLPNTPKL